MLNHISSRGLFSTFFRGKVKRLEGIPGPPPCFPLGNVCDFAKHSPHRLLELYHSKYGQVVLFWLGNRPNLLINSPNLIEDVLVNNRACYFKNNPHAAAWPVMRQSVFLANGDDWKFKRENHPLENHSIHQYLQTVGDTCIKLTDSYLASLAISALPTKVDFFDELVGLSFKAFGTAIFNSPMTDQLYADFGRLMKELTDRGGRLIAISPDPFFWLARRRWFRFISNTIRVRNEKERKEQETRNDLISFVKSHGGSGLNDDQLRDELSTIFTAGTRNVAVTVAAAMFLLNQNTEIKEKLVGEIKALPALTHGAIKDLHMLDLVVKETLRVFPAVPFFIREVQPNKQVELDGHQLPRKTQIFVSSWTLHRDAKVWQAPSKFDPYRFEKEIPANHYIPFGFGPRACVGAMLTITCVKTMLATILSQTSYEIDSSIDFSTKYFAGTVMPEAGLPITFININH